MKRETRDAILAEDVVRPQTPRERRELAGLDEDLRSSPLRGEALPLRLRNFTPDAGGYLAALGGPRPYMARLREIDALTADHEVRLGAVRDALRREVPPGAERDRRLLELVERWSFDEVNDLIARHNRWYPVEARLPMDPRRGDFALVNGKDYRRRPLDAAWALELLAA